MVRQNWGGLAQATLSPRAARLPREEEAEGAQRWGAIRTRADHSRELQGHPPDTCHLSAVSGSHSDMCGQKPFPYLPLQATITLSLELVLQLSHPSWQCHTKLPTAPPVGLSGAPAASEPPPVPTCSLQTTGPHCAYIRSIVREGRSVTCVLSLRSPRAMSLTVHPPPPSKLASDVFH